MLTTDLVKNKVRTFQGRTNFGRSEEDNFTPWWIQQTFKTSDEEATMLCSDGNFEFGLDGFYIEDKNEKTILTLVQAKYTENLNEVKKGINDINRFLHELSKMLKKIESDNSHYQENILIKRFRSKISKIQITELNQLEIKANVISLHKLPKEIIENKTASAQEELRKTVNKTFSDPNINFSLKILGITDLIEDDTSFSIRPAKPFTLYFDGSSTVKMNDSLFLSGIGKVSDLVELYEIKGNQLFDKNVRLFLYGKKNETKGPSGKIKESLSKIISGDFPPEKFAFLHNGVTIYAQNLTKLDSENKIEISNPSVLNGCQTIKSAFFFYQDQRLKEKLDQEIWENIPITVRVVCTQEDKLWREVAESNNRQNSMKSSALRANDNIQIELENRFKDIKIFYQRQDKAFENISRSDYELIEEVFSNSPKEPITIETLAQTIIDISELPLSYATRYNDIFESHSLYEKVFSSKFLKNLSFLVFSHNVRWVMDLAIKKAISSKKKKFEKFSFKKFRDLFTRMYLKAILKHKNYDLIDEYGKDVLTRKGKLSQNLQEEIRKTINSHHIPIVKLVGDYYWNSKNYTWSKQDDNELLKKLERKLKFDNTNIVEIVNKFENIDIE